MAGLDVELEILPAKGDLWACPACTFYNKAKRKRCEMCETPKPDDNNPTTETKVAHEEKKSPIQQMAIDHKWAESSSFQPKSLQKVGNQMMIRILDFCDPGDIVSIGTASRWCQTLSVRPELWRNLFDRDHEHFLDELPDRKKLLASSLLDSVISQTSSLFRQPGWERDGGGKKAYLSVLRGLNTRCDQKVQELHESTLRTQQYQHENRTEDYLNFLWGVLGFGFVLFVVTLILLIVKLMFPDSMGWAAVLGPMASGFALHSLFLLLGGVYSSVACCLHPKALVNMNWSGAGLFWMGLVSIPWGMFPVLLILEIEGITHWSYSYIFISFYLAIVGAAIVWTCWLYVDNGGYCSSSLTAPVLVSYVIVALLLGLFIPMGLKLDGLYDGLWVVIWTPIWISLFVVCAGSCFLSYVLVDDHDYFKLLFWIPILDLLAQFILVPLKLDNPDMCDWLFILMPLILCMCCIVCACCVGVGFGIYDAAR